ncbi:V(D)J recombination-activating protein 1-like [Asterias amurensis]|uniref:V(D)J recombination-activating protein 1-like n=1 Tax=Asterias amurensis TaxID=7602 RepID=UPI003AB9117C
MEHHQAVLAKLCRICARRLETAKQKQAGKSNTKPVDCSKYRKEAYAVFNLSTWEDNPEVHPGSVCYKCSRSLRYASQGDRLDSSPDHENALRLPRLKWTKHPRTGECDICEQFSRQTVGGHQPNRERPGQSVIVNSNKCTLPTHDLFGIEKDNCTSVSPLLEICGKSSEEQNIFICPICQCILSSPAIQTLCEHNFCAICLSSWFKYNNSPEVPCPVCRQPVHFTNVSPCPRVLRFQLSTLTTACSKCGSLGKLEKMLSHECPSKKADCHCKLCYAPSEPPPSSEESEIIKAAKLLEKVASQHVRGTPIPPQIEAAADRWTWHKLKVHGTAKLKTPGRVSTFKKYVHTVFKFDFKCQ